MSIIKHISVISFYLLLLPFLMVKTVPAAETEKQIFAHKTIEDKYGVITPWYQGQNGQFDNRIRIAAETLKRYPWVTKERAIAVAPEFVFNLAWRISEDGTISIPHAGNWLNGSVPQSAARMMNAMVEYYQYSGDAAPLAFMTIVADTFLDVCQTPASHAWPRFPITVPVQGEPYGHCNTKGWIQLDIAGELGVALLRAYQVTGNQRWLDTVTHWGELLAANQNRTPGAELWGRYANPEDVYKFDVPDNERSHWGNRRTDDVLEGSITYILAMFDELIRLGQHGENNSFIKSRNAGKAYLRDVALPRWHINSTWGHNYWDNGKPYQLQTTSDWVVRYLMANKADFPNWRNDVRNILSLFLNHTSANPDSKTDTYSGAWAFPESTNCCSSSLAWAPMEFSLVLAQYGVEADSEWGRELARRMAILSTYDAHETGVVEDKIDGGSISAGSWFHGTHPSTLAWLLRTMGWLPEILGANRENHIMRSTAVVNQVSYRKGKVAYSTYDAPSDTVGVLRLAFRPTSIKACGQEVEASTGALSSTSKALEGGDHIVTIRHDGCTDIVVKGEDPQLELATGSARSFKFKGNQVRLLGKVGPEGGRADVYLDGVKQLALIDFWNPEQLSGQVVYSRGGLSNGFHTLRIAPRSEHNPLSEGDQVALEFLQSSSATGDSGVGVGGGPTATQRMIFGYTERTDYVDESGNRWRPGTEMVTRTGQRSDTVAKTWWTMKQATFILDTSDDPLYQHGVHWPEIVVNVTVGPGNYYARLKLAETQYSEPNKRAMSIFINDKQVASNLDVYATAAVGDVKGISHKNAYTPVGVDLVYNNITPENGIIEIRLMGEAINGVMSEAILQALEVGPGHGGVGASLVGVSK